MRHAALFLSVFFYSWLATSCEKPLPTDQHPTPAASLHLSPTMQQLLEAQISSQEAVWQLSSRKEWPSLPEEPNYFRDLHYNALLAGSRRTLRRNYQRIGSPQRQATKHLDLSYQDIH